MPYTIEIYQLKEGEENRLRRWISFDSLGKMGEIPTLLNYNKVYTMQQDSRPELERIYQRFNVDHPKDFTGHSMSVSDIVVVRGRDHLTAHYVDSIGFVRILDFAKQLMASEAGKEASKEPVGIIRYLDSNETIGYSDSVKYIAAYQEALYCMGPNGVRATTLTKDFSVRYEIEKVLVGEFGEEIEDKETWIKKHAQSLDAVPKVDPEQVNSFMKDRGAAEPEDELEL